MEEELESKRGKPLTCKYCKKEFRFELKSERQVWIESVYQCPNCNIDYCILPPTERDLRHLQAAYLKSRTNKDLIAMVKILHSYCGSLIKKSFSNKIQEPGKLEYYVHHAVTFLIEDYLSKPNFSIQTSFGGFLIHKIRQAIFGKPEHDMDADSMDFMFDDGNQVQYSDHKDCVIDSLHKRTEKEHIAKKLSELIYRIEDYCSSREENYIRLLNVHNHLYAGENNPDKFFNCYDKTGKMKYIESMELLRKELQTVET